MSASETGHGNMKHYRAMDFVCMGVPEGFQTAWGWLAANEPAAYEFMQAPGRDAKEFQDRACIVAREEGICGIPFDAPDPIVLTGGPPIVLAFPNLVFRYVFAA